MVSFGHKNSLNKKIIGMNTGLKGKTVLITGGSSGIGKATALAFGKEPHSKIAITYYHHEETAREVVQAIEQDGGSALAVYMSLGDHASIDEAVRTITRKFGSIDVLVNNAVF